MLEITCDLWIRLGRSHFFDLHHMEDIFARLFYILKISYSINFLKIVLIYNIRT